MKKRSDRHDQWIVFRIVVAEYGGIGGSFVVAQYATKDQAQLHRRLATRWSKKNLASVPPRAKKPINPYDPTASRKELLRCYYIVENHRGWKTYRHVDEFLEENGQ